MIEFMDLKISFGKKIIVKEMNDQFSENKIIGLVAPNGTGKTTLLRTLAGIKKPADGYVKINDWICTANAKNISNKFSFWKTVTSYMQI